MPLPALDVSQTAAALKSMQPELRFLLRDRGVQEATIAVLSHKGVKRIEVF